MARASILLAYHCKNTDNREKPLPLDSTGHISVTWLVQSCVVLSSAHFQMQSIMPAR